MLCAVHIFICRAEWVAISKSVVLVKRFFPDYRPLWLRTSLSILQCHRLMARTVLKGMYDWDKVLAFVLPSANNWNFNWTQFDTICWNGGEIYFDSQRLMYEIFVFFSNKTIKQFWNIQYISLEIFYCKQLKQIYKVLVFVLSTTNSWNFNWT